MEKLPKSFRSIFTSKDLDCNDYINDTSSSRDNKHSTSLRSLSPSTFLRSPRSPRSPNLPDTPRFSRSPNPSSTPRSSRSPNPPSSQNNPRTSNPSSFLGPTKSPNLASSPSTSTSLTKTIGEFIKSHKRSLSGSNSGLGISSTNANCNSSGNGLSPVTEDNKLGSKFDYKVDDSKSDKKAIPGTISEIPVIKATEASSPSTANANNTATNTIDADNTINTDNNCTNGYSANSATSTAVPPLTPGSKILSSSPPQTLATSESTIAEKTPKSSIEQTPNTNIANPLATNVSKPLKNNGEEILDNFGKNQHGQSQHDHRQQQHIPCLMELNSTNTLELSPGEINDADLESDDHEELDDDDDDSDVVTDPIPITSLLPTDDDSNSNDGSNSNDDSGSAAALSPPLIRTRSHMSHQYAESIIGGISAPTSTTHLPLEYSLESDTEGDTNDASGPNANISANVNTNNASSRTNTSHAHTGSTSSSNFSPSFLYKSRMDESDRRTFSFSLPFSNPLANIEFPSLKLPSFMSFANDGTNVVSNNNIIDTNSTNNNTRKAYVDAQRQVGENLARQLSIASWQEEIVYNTFKEQDNSRLRAVRLALTPNILQNKLDTGELNGFRGEVVVMGGFRGSILRDRATGRRVWIPIKAGFNLRKIDLTVGIRDEDEYNMESKVYPSGMLTHIGPVDISRKLIKRLKEMPNCTVYEFSYDWRLSSDINSAKLVKFLESLPSNKSRNVNNSTRRGPIVIAHSMGGLIAHHAMQQNPELFRGLVYAGVPAACPNILGPLRNGDSILLSSKILTAQVNFLMRSSYVFLPLDGHCFVNAKDHSIKYDLDFFDVNTWIEHELSPLVAKSSRHKKEQQQQQSIFGESSKLTDSFTYPDSYYISYDNAVSYLDRTLKRTKKFLDELEYNPSLADKYPPLACLYSHSIPTLKGAEVESKEAIKNDTYENFLFGPGDGVIYYKSLMPEGKKGFNVVTKVATDRGHVSLLNDVDSVFKTIGAILDCEREKESRF